MMAVLVACQVQTNAANNDNKKEGDQRELDREKLWSRNQKMMNTTKIKGTLSFEGRKNQTEVTRRPKCRSIERIEASDL